MRALNAIDEHRDDNGFDTLRWTETGKRQKTMDCTWTPSKKNPQQTVSKAGLCDGADLAIVKVSYWKGERSSITAKQ